MAIVVVFYVANVVVFHVASDDSNLDLDSVHLGQAVSFHSSAACQNRIRQSSPVVHWMDPIQGCSCVIERFAMVIAAVHLAVVDLFYAARQWILLQPDVVAAFVGAISLVAQLRRFLQIFEIQLICLMNLVTMLAERRLDVGFLFHLDVFYGVLLNNENPITISYRNDEAAGQALPVIKLTHLLWIERVFCFVGRAVPRSLALLLHLVSIQFGVDSNNARDAKVILSSVLFEFADQSVLLVVECSKPVVICFASAIRTNQLIAFNETCRG